MSFLQVVVDFPLEHVLLATHSTAETALVNVLLDVGFELGRLCTGATDWTEDVGDSAFPHYPVLTVGKVLAYRVDISVRSQALSPWQTSFEEATLMDSPASAMLISSFSID